MLDTMAQNYGRGAAQGFQDYGDIMGRYGDVSKKFGDLSSNYSGVSSKYGDIQDQYRTLGGPSGYGEFAKTGGYSPTDIAGMRSRGVSPIRAAYSNAEREVGRQRALQGGYSPNATATLAKMAREQGQAGSDAATNVEANLAGMKQQGRLAGLQGQAGAIQGQMGAVGGRLDSTQGQSNAIGGQLNAAQGQAGLYGATPGMASTFGNQILSGTGQSGQFGMNLMGNDIQGQNLPGQLDTTTGKINDIANMAYPWIDYFENRNQKVPSAGGVNVPMPPPYNPTVFPNPQGDTIIDTQFGSPIGGGYQPGYNMGNSNTPIGPSPTFGIQQPQARRPGMFGV